MAKWRYAGGKSRENQHRANKCRVLAGRRFSNPVHLKLRRSGIFVEQFENYS
jgi:hypothetical protein